MILSSPHKSRERWLFYGPPGQGKTTLWMQMVAATTGKAFVLDTDQTVNRFLDSETYAGLEDRIELSEPFEWPEYVEGVKKARQDGGRDDFLVVDLFGPAWDAVQSYFSEQVFGQELGAFFTEYMRQLEQNDGKGSKSPFDGNTDWQAIKKLYRELTANIARFPGHVVLVAGEKQLSPWDDAKAQSLYSNVNNMKPDAQKDSPYMVHTVLRVNRQRLYTVKDRERKQLDGEKVTDFSKDYLLRVAGWRPVIGGAS